MLNAEPNTTSDILSENGSHHTSIVLAVPSRHHPSPHRPGRLASDARTRTTSRRDKLTGPRYSLFRGIE